ncbi:PREDICTED: uncharacterized protein LOC106805117 [Priapulus caudatus]|uniref:Uncharacterized protein LOC106805117 n=1 Tax=Priapulus caudatus TaxID=37621 RepID=A0ABM1DQ63_PRICU|nr:PREDICTED: uncharacterized protein LOC106805117 [Priapulus caudatus]
MAALREVVNETPVTESEIQNIVAGQDDVFVNGGEAEESSMDSSLHQSGELLDVPVNLTPRRGSGSIMKDESKRKPSHKKTVSFSSMPTERKISKGRKYGCTSVTEVYAFVKSKA